MPRVPQQEAPAEPMELTTGLSPSPEDAELSAEEAGEDMEDVEDEEGEEDDEDSPETGEYNIRCSKAALFRSVKGYSCRISTDKMEPFDSTGLKEIGNLASWTVSTAKPGCGVEALRDENTNLFWQ